jgi:TolB-like protein
MKKSIIIFLVLSFFSVAALADEWYEDYQEGVELLKVGDHRTATRKFQSALSKKAKDTRRIRTYGMHFIEYYPNRELGICLYFLGDTEGAEEYLNVSMSQQPSERAKKFLKKIDKNILASDPLETPAKPSAKPSTPSPSVSPAAPSVGILAPVGSRTKREIEAAKESVGEPGIKLVGERMSIAVFPFLNKGTSNNLGEIVLDKFITALFNLERFKVIERSQLERILAEQKLGLSGIIDASTAAEVGKGIGVDAIVLGSVALGTDGSSVSLDARAIDTESATIIVAHDAYTSRSDAQSVKAAVDNLVVKFEKSIPLVEGYIIRANNPLSIMLDAGRNYGLAKGMKCIIYSEGEEVKHPITGEVMGKETTIVGEVLITDTFQKFSTARITKETANPIVVGNKFLTK